MDSDKTRRRRCRVDVPGESTPFETQKGKRMQDLPGPFFAKSVSTIDQVRLKLGGECDAATLEQLNDALQEAIAQQRNEVVVDLGEVTFIDSLSLAALTIAAKQVRGSGRSFSVTRATMPDVRRVFEITGLATYLLVSTQN
jgi:anti-sigma B factor antagonist